MVKGITYQDIEFLNEVANKYRFLDTVEIEDEDAYSFCCRFLQAVNLGLHADAADIDEVREIRDTLGVGY